MRDWEGGREGKGRRMEGRGGKGREGGAPQTKIYYYTTE